MKLTLLPADKGDCMFLESQNTAILIDGGLPDSYVEFVRPFLGKWRQQHQRPLDLVYLSHIDQDHIGGVLQLMNDLVDWRVYKHKDANGEEWDKPDFAEPPEIARLWHNGFHDLIGENAGEIGSMLAARATQLINSANPELRKLAADYQAIATSIPESIKLSSRVSTKQLKIPLNKEFGGLLAMVREPPDEIRLNGPSSPLIRIIGPFAEDLEKLRLKWDDWLRNKKNKQNLRRTRKWRDDEEERFDFSGVVALDIDDELGDRKEVTEENLASLMLLVEQNGKRILLTGDGHHTDILHGLEHNGAPAGQGIHVDVLKIQHHGSEHNLDRDFARRVTADNYVICGNGRHENPDLQVLQVLVESRIGSPQQRSTNPQTGQTFHVWFNCSVAFLEKQIERRADASLSNVEYKKALKHFKNIERDMRKYETQSNGKLKLHYLKDTPLVLDLGA